MRRGEPGIGRESRNKQLIATPQMGAWKPQRPADFSVWLDHGVRKESRKRTDGEVIRTKVTERPVCHVKLAFQGQSGATEGSVIQDSSP